MIQNRQDLRDNGVAQLSKTFGDGPDEEKNNGQPEVEESTEDTVVVVKKEPTKKISVPELPIKTPMEKARTILFALAVVLLNFFTIFEVFPLGENTYLSELAIFGDLQNSAIEDWKLSYVYALGLSIFITFIAHRWWRFFIVHGLHVNLDWLLENPRERFRFVFISIAYGLSMILEIIFLAMRLQLNSAIGEDLLDDTAQQSFLVILGLSLAIVFINAICAWFNEGGMNE